MTERTAFDEWFDSKGFRESGIPFGRELARSAWSAAISITPNETKAELDRLRALINTPHTDDWFSAVRLEAAHQIERWGADHDVGEAIAGPAPSSSSARCSSTANTARRRFAMSPTDIVRRPNFAGGGITAEEKWAAKYCAVYRPS